MAASVSSSVFGWASWKKLVRGVVPAVMRARWGNAIERGLVAGYIRLCHTMLVHVLKLLIILMKWRQGVVKLRLLVLDIQVKVRHLLLVLKI